MSGVGTFVAADQGGNTQQPSKQDLILLKDVCYFGRWIRRGATFKPENGTRDWYVLWENRDGIIMHCPAVRLHYTAVTEEYFVKQYA